VIRALSAIPLAARRLLFWAAALFTFAMAVLPQPPRVPASDKLQHMAAFAVLAVLAAWAYPRTRTFRLIAGLSLFGALIEVVQAIPALHRDCDVKDWLADTLACGVVLVAIHWLRALTRDQGNRVASDGR
jgi:VanZ family protein